MAGESPRSVSRRMAAAKEGAGLLSPRFRSAVEMAGWDEESILLAALVVEDTPVRESRRKRRPSSGGGSAGSNTRKRRSWRQSAAKIPPVVLALDDEDKTDNSADAKKGVKEDKENAVVKGETETSGSAEKAVVTGGVPCMDKLREELSCAICLEVCFEPSTTPCGHSFCMKCLKHAAAKCGKRCPKCRQLISNSRSCTVNTVLWNTIQLLFPSEVEARRCSIASSSESKDAVKQSPPRGNSFAQGGMRTRHTSRSFSTQETTRSHNANRSFITPGSRRSINTTGSFVTQGSSSRRSRDSSGGFVRASQLVTTRGSVGSEQPVNDATLAYRLQQQEFMTAFDHGEADRQPRNTLFMTAFEREEGTRQPENQSTVSTARANLRAIASRAVRLRARGWPL